MSNVNRNFIITTTQLLDGYQVKAYLGAININIVIGTNYFSDVAASFTDVFGGNSGTYQRKMDAMYENAKEELVKKAKRLGGNAILAFHTDFDEISGKGKSMFMLSATGTACVVEMSSRTVEKVEGKLAIDSAQLTQELSKQNIIEKLSKQSSYIVESDWAFLSEHPSADVVDILFQVHFLTMDENEKTKAAALLQLISYEDASSIIYKLYKSVDEGDGTYNATENLRAVGNLIRKNSLFSPAETLELISISPTKAAFVLRADKPYYDMEDLKVMKEILARFDNLPDLGKIEVGKNGMFSKEKELYICRHGHKNDKEMVHCSTCSENIKGLHGSDLDDIAQFKNKVEMLEKLMKP